MAPKSDTSLFVLVPVLVFVFVWTYYTSSANHFPHPITTPLWRTLALHLNGGLLPIYLFYRSNKPAASSSSTPLCPTPPPTTTTSHSLSCYLTLPPLLSLFTHTHTHNH